MLISDLPVPVGPNKPTISFSGSFNTFTALSCPMVIGFNLSNMAELYNITYKHLHRQSRGAAKGGSGSGGHERREDTARKEEIPANPGKWSLPGGHVELGERLEEAVLRELREETGIGGVVKKFLAPVEYIETEGARVKYHFVILVYLVEAAEGEPRAGDDAEDALFIPLEEALKMDLTKTTREILQSLAPKG
jgi:ADP-ribose pyrophosphatase